MRRRPLLACAAALVAATAMHAPSARAEPPSAAFVWFPSSPLTGETVSLASTSTDASSAITGWSWDLAGDGAFQPGGAVTSTAFMSPGAHVVRLLVSAADGSSSLVAETIEVASPAPAEMLPPPIVRVVSTDRTGGVDMRLISVEAPPGALISVTCRGRGCPLTHVSRVMSASAESSAVDFPHLQRFLRAGTTLEIRVSKAGEVGKYTRLTIRAGRPPARIDACLYPGSPAPRSCPATALAAAAVFAGAL